MSYAGSSGGSGVSGVGGGREVRRVVRKYHAPRKQEERIAEIAATPTRELRDWSHLPDLVISDVLSRLVPCLRSLSAFAATCRPWRRFFISTAASTILPRIPPLMLQVTNRSAHFVGSSPQVIRKPVKLARPATRSTLLSSSRGHLILLNRPRHVLHVVDALTGAEHLAVRLPWSISPSHYASLTPTHLILFVHEHAFISLPFPTGNPDPGNPGPEDWTHHQLPPAASSVTAVIEFRGRVLGITDRAELLEFRLDVNTEVQLLQTTGLPEISTFEHSVFGPRLVVAGDRLLLLLLVLTTRRTEVAKVSVHALDMAAMTWEELDGIGDYSLFVDCPGRSAVACVGGGYGVMPNRVYFLVSRSYYCFEHGGPAFQAFPPGPHGDGGQQGWHALISDDRDWPPSQTWVYPRLLYRC